MKIEKLLMLMILNSAILAISTISIQNNNLLRKNKEGSTIHLKDLLGLVVIPENKRNSNIPNSNMNANNLNNQNSNSAYPRFAQSNISIPMYNTNSNYISEAEREKQKDLNQKALLLNDILKEIR